MEELMRIVDPRDPLDLYERHTMIVDSGHLQTVEAPAESTLHMIA